MFSSIFPTDAKKPPKHWLPWKQAAERVRLFLNHNGLDSTMNGRNCWSVRMNKTASSCFLVEVIVDKVFVQQVEPVATLTGFMDAAWEKLNSWQCLSWAHGNYDDLSTLRCQFIWLFHLSSTGMSLFKEDSLSSYRFTESGVIWFANRDKMFPQNWL